MTSFHPVDWIVALLVCWASLTAIVQSPHETMQCDISSATSSAPQIPLATPIQAETDATIRDMKLHD